jgi:hypothetical protein
MRKYKKESEVKDLEFGVYVRRTFRDDGNKLFVKRYSDKLDVIFSIPMKSETDPQPDFWEELTQVVQKYFKD